MLLSTLLVLMVAKQMASHLAPPANASANYKDLYQECRCADNIARLCHQLQTEGAKMSKFKVIYALPSKYTYDTPFREQTRGTRCYWNFHVLLLDAANMKVYDFGTTLGFPVDFKKYLKATWPSSGGTRRMYYAQLRVIPAGYYLKMWIKFGNYKAHSDRGGCKKWWDFVDYCLKSGIEGPGKEYPNVEVMYASLTWESLDGKRFYTVA